MVEKIKLLNELSNIELIKMLEISDLSLEKIIDLKIIIERVFRDKDIDANIRNNFDNYDLELSESAVKLLGKVWFMDLLALIKEKKLNTNELLYMNYLIEKEIVSRLINKDLLNIKDVNSSFYLSDSSIFNFGNINLFSFKQLLIGFDEKYNFYVGKIDSNKHCVLINIMRKGLPYDVSRDMFVFNGYVMQDNKLYGNWSTGTREVDEAIEDINDMSDVFDYRKLKNDNRNKRGDLNISYIACNENTDNLKRLMKRLNNNKILNTKVG